MPVMLAGVEQPVVGAYPLYRRSVEVSMGAAFALPYARMTDWRNGLSSRRLHEADHPVRIPMDDTALARGVDSLNVVAAAAIACHILARD